ncbi:hypothetical protein OAU50_03750 [Planctomycetota bacterium]|nr:hypothetical protein [Planctomycetota bacterium]
MAQDHLREEDYVEVELKWVHPRLVLDDSEDFLRDEAWDYRGVHRFERTHAASTSAKPEIIYIGISYSQSIAERVLGHSKKFRDWRARGELYFSFAPLDFYGRNHVRKYYEAVEHLLIYVMQPKHNTQKMNSMPNVAIDLDNMGSRGGLPREIIYPTAKIKW